MDYKACLKNLMIKFCDYWHPMGNYKSLNNWFNDTMYLLICTNIPSSPKFVKCRINFKPRKKHMYKTKKTSKLYGSRFIARDITPHVASQTTMINITIGQRAHSHAGTWLWALIFLFLCLSRFMAWNHSQV